jgi:hypothetical protein
MQDRDYNIPILALSPDDAAVASGRTRTRIFEAINAGELQARKDGKAVIIGMPELMRWVKTFPLREPNPRHKPESEKAA